MYESFYGLKEKPFSMLPDPGFLYLSKKHQMALTLLEYGLLNQAGFCVVSGETGSGKTTLLRKLLENITEDVTVGMITNTHKGFGELLDWVLSAFGIHEQGMSLVDMHQRFIDFLIEQYAANKSTLLIVDEAQNMSAEKLEELRMLSNVNSDKDQVLQVILAGQPELKETLKLPELMQFAQRIAVDYHLGSLNEEETYGYIHHRLEVAGANQEIFTEAACDRIHEYSGGIPRLINLLCDTVMVYGFADQQKVVNEELVDEMIQERMKDSIVPLASSISSENRKAEPKQDKKPKSNLRHYPLTDEETGEKPFSAEALAAGNEDEKIEKEEVLPNEHPDDSMRVYDEAVESIEQMVSESVEIDEPEAIIKGRDQGDVIRREPGVITVIEPEAVVKVNNWKWIAISAVALAVTVLALVFGGEFSSDNDNRATSTATASSDVQRQSAQEIPDRIKMQLSEAEKFREELARRQEEDRARMTALEKQAEQLQRERDAALAKARTEEERRAKEAAMAEVAALKEREAKRLAELAKAEAIAAAREKALMLEELREAERAAKQKAMREKELMKQQAILEATTEEAVQQKPAAKPVSQNKVRKEKKKVESFSTDPCSSSTARFLSTCR